MTTHYLKTWPYYFCLMCDGSKTFEYRRNDRNYQVGDRLVLQEWDPGSACYSGQEFRCKVMLVVTAAPGLPVGHCIMQTEALDRQEGGKDVSKRNDCSRA